jgi:hypothetical protein
VTYESVDDLTAPWMGNGVNLAERMLVLADEVEVQLGHPDAAEAIRDVVRCEYNPIPDPRPQLGFPPTLRPAVPPRPEPGS